MIVEVIRKKGLIFLSLFLLMSCSVDKDEELSDLIENNENHKDSVWFEQESSLYPGEWDKVVLVFGWIDDQVECERIKETYEEKYPKTNYRCNPVK